MAEDEFKSKLQQLEGVINGLNKQLEAKDGIPQCNNEKQNQLQATIDVITKTGEANNRTVEELREKQKQLQATTDRLTKTVEALNQTVQLRCVHPKDVSTYTVEAVSTREWAEIPPAVNIANFRPSTVGW